MARIVLDRIVGLSGAVEAEVVVHTEAAAWNTVANPLAPGETMPVLAFLQLCKVNPAVRAAAAYDAASHRPGKSRWDLLVDAGAV